MTFPNGEGMSEEIWKTEKPSVSLIVEKEQFIQCCREEIERIHPYGMSTLLPPVASTSGSIVFSGSINLGRLQEVLRHKYSTLYHHVLDGDPVSRGRWKVFATTSLGLILFEYPKEDFQAFPSLFSYILPDETRAYCSGETLSRVREADVLVGNLLLHTYLRIDYLLPLSLRLLGNCILGRSTEYGVPPFLHQEETMRSSWSSPPPAGWSPIDPHGLPSPPPGPPPRPVSPLETCTSPQDATPGDRAFLFRDSRDDTSSSHPGEKKVLTLALGGKPPQGSEKIQLFHWRKGVAALLQEAAPIVSALTRGHLQSIVHSLLLFVLSFPLPSHRHRTSLVERSIPSLDTAIPCAWKEVWMSTPPLLGEGGGTALAPSSSSMVDCSVRTPDHEDRSNEVSGDPAIRPSPVKREKRMYHSVATYHPPLGCWMWGGHAYTCEALVKVLETYRGEDSKPLTSGHLHQVYAWWKELVQTPSLKEKM